MPMTPKIREDYINKFFPDIDAAEHVRLLEMSAQDLLDEYDMALCEAKKRWPTMNMDAEWSNMVDWLSERGVTSGSRSF